MQHTLETSSAPCFSARLRLRLLRSRRLLLLRLLLWLESVGQVEFVHHARRQRIHRIDGSEVRVTEQAESRQSEVGVEYVGHVPRSVADAPALVILAVENEGSEGTPVDPVGVTDDR